ncbi:MAG: hypothetical protein ABFS10_14175 [Bacteroidota bacterium]
MATKFFSLEQMAAVYNPEQDWLFEKHLEILNSHKHLILSAEQGWGIQEYANELGFQLTEKNPDIHVCKIDLMPVHSLTAFLEHFAAAFSLRFPVVTSRMQIDSSSINTLKLPALIAQRKRIRVAVFLANSHLFNRFKDPGTFLRTLKLKLKNQKNCIFCLYGKNTPNFRDLVHYPGPLSGLGQLSELRHNPVKHRSASIRKLFHDHEKNIGYATSVRMSYMVDNHPFYLKLLAWHALIRTRHTCTTTIVEKALNDLTHHFNHRFHKITERLTLKQLNFLQALVEGNQMLYSKTTRNKYQLGSSSNVAKIIQNLEKKEIIYTGNMEPGFTDPVFSEWLRSRYFVSE